MRRSTVVGGVLAAVVALVLGAYAWRVFRVEQVVGHNVEARGGAPAWRAVHAIRYTGQMDVGQGVRVPYVLEQKDPGKMRLEFQLGGQTAVQCTDGATGWTIAPYRGVAGPQPMSPEDLAEVADFASPAGLLFDHSARGTSVRRLGREAVRGQEADKLEVTLAGGAVRWVWVDVQTGLELKVESTRTLGARALRVETYYSDWQPTPEGVLVARRQETQTEGDPAVHVLTVETVKVNPPLEDARFERPQG